MKLLQDIKTDLIEPGVSLCVALRKMKILASKLQNTKIKEWVHNELNGYNVNDRSEIPEYRKFFGHNFGHFAGPFQSELNNAPIPIVCLPDIVKEIAEYNDIIEGVRILESYNDSQEGVLKAHWPADLIVFTQKNTPIYQNMNLIDAWKIIPRSQIDGILDIIRNKCLDFILELEEQYPEAIESEASLKNIPVDQVTSFVVNNIYGGQNVMATGSNIDQKVGNLVIQNDINSLKNVLQEKGVPQVEITSLENSIKSDGSLIDNKLGKKVSSWLGKVSAKIYNGTIAVSKNSAPVVAAEVAKAIMKYYGLS